MLSAIDHCYCCSSIPDDATTSSVASSSSMEAAAGLKPKPAPSKAAAAIADADALSSTATNATPISTSTTNTTPSSSSQSLSAIQSALVRLKEVGVNFLALDFDQTILDIHTGGAWKGTLPEIFPHVRPVFVDLMRAAQAADLQIAVVTFTNQTFLVRGVLDSVLKDGSTKVPIRGGDRSWTYSGKGSHVGKQPHMASAVEELEHRFDVQISKKSTLLIDDDPKNIRYALREGVRAIWFNPQKPHRLLQEIRKLV